MGEENVEICFRIKLVYLQIFYCNSVAKPLAFGGDVDGGAVADKQRS